LHLDSAHEKLLRGEEGEARQLAMDILARVKGDSAEVVLRG
jgi:predicted aconitase